MSLPLEIIELIVDASAPKDKRSIEALSLVCRALLPRCRKHLFENLSIREATHGRKGLWELFSGRPELCPYVCIIDYTFDNGPLPHDWTPLVSQRLTQLRCLHIEPKSDTGSEVTWNATPHCHVILALLHRPTLTHFRLRHIDDFFISDLTPCAGLKYLEVSSGRLEDGPGCPQIPPHKPITINQLSIESVDSSSLISLASARSDGIPIFDLSTLKKICLTTGHDGELWGLKGFFENAPQLVHLEISTYLAERPQLNGLYDNILRSLPMLRYLNISFLTPRTPNGNIGDSLTVLARELDKLRFQNVIQTIEFFVFTDLGAHFEQAGKWGALDRTLSEAGWPSLMYVSLMIKSYFTADLESQAAQLLRLRGTHFARLLSSPTVHFDIKHWNMTGFLSYDNDSSEVEYEGIW